MKKVRKGKKMLISLIAIVAIMVVVFAIVAITKAVKKNKENQSQEGQETAISLPDTTYSDMEVKNIYMEYLKDEDKTMVSMSILNTTDKKVEDESLNAILIGSDENVLGQMQTWIQSLDVGEQYKCYTKWKPNRNKSCKARKSNNRYTNNRRIVFIDFHKNLNILYKEEKI